MLTGGLSEELLGMWCWVSGFGSEEFRVVVSSWSSIPSFRDDRADACAMSVRSVMSASGSVALEVSLRSASRCQGNRFSEYVRTSE